MELETQNNRPRQSIPNMRIAIGKLVSVNNVNRVGAASVQGEPNTITVVFSGLAAEHQSVEITEGFTVGDQVLVAYYASDDILASSPSLRGVVICKLALSDTTFIDLLTAGGDKIAADVISAEAESPVARSYNENHAGEIFGQDIVQFPAANNINCFTGQNQNISGDSTNFTVSHSDISIKAGDSHITVNELGVATDKCLWKQSQNLSTIRTNYLIGDTLLDEEIQTTDIAGSYTRINKFGALSDGISDALVEKGGKVVSRVKRTVDGITKIDVGEAFIVERGGHCVAAMNNDMTPIKPLDSTTAPNITNVDSYDFIEDGLTESKSVGLYKTVDSGLVEPLKSPKDIQKQKGPKNPVTGRVVESVSGRSRFGVQTDGSIVLSDAWGSEIRMFGGDIFITPARRLVVLSPEDTIVSAGGALSAVGTELVNVGSAGGPVEVVGKSINLCGQSVRLIGKDDAEIAAGKLSITAEQDVAVVAGTSIDLMSDANISIAADTCYIVGYNLAAIGSSASTLKLCGAAAEVGSRQFTVLSDLIVSDSKATGFKLNDKKVAPSSGSGYINCAGYCMVNKGLTVNQWLSTPGTIHAESVMVKSVNKEAIGVFQSSNKPSSESVPRVSAISTGDYVTEVTTNPKEVVKTITKELFKFETSGAYAIVPEWFGRSGKAPQPVVIEGAVSGGYIYPGRDFWEKSGAFIIKSEDYYNIYNTPTTTVTGVRNIK